MIKKITNWISNKVKYLTEDIWRVPLGELPRRQTFLVREIRILVLAFKGFREDKVQLRASALTFKYSLINYTCGCYCFWYSTELWV